MDSLNEIRLTPQMIAELYGQALIAPIDHTRVKDPVHKPGIHFLGHNKKHVTVLVDQPGHTFLPEAELAFLTRMLEACKLNLADVAIVNRSAEKWTLEDVHQQLSPKVILAFGGPAGQEQFSISSSENAQLLVAPDLEEMAGDTAEARQLKTRLWGALKQLFRI